MSKFKYIIIGIISAVILFLSGWFAKGCYPEKDIQVIPMPISPTVWKIPIKEKPKLKNLTQKDFDYFYDCTTSDLWAKETLNKNWLTVKFGDDCKKAEVKYKITQTKDWKMYFVIGSIAAITGGIITYKLLK